MSESLDASNSDLALLELYDRISSRSSWTRLSPAERREYFRLARQRSRARDRAAMRDGNPLASEANIRTVLADAALLLLAADALGAIQIRALLSQAFARRPGVPMAVERRIKTGKLRPKLIEVAP